MIPFTTFPIRIDRKTWAAFKARAASEGLSATAAILRLIEHFIANGLPPEKPRKKDL
jgi:hypothetical protein